MTALWCHGEALCHGDPANGGVKPYGNTHSFDGAQDDIPREPQDDMGHGEALEPYSHTLREPQGDILR